MSKDSNHKHCCTIVPTQLMCGSITAVRWWWLQSWWWHLKSCPVEARWCFGESLGPCAFSFDTALLQTMYTGTIFLDGFGLVLQDNASRHTAKMLLQWFEQHSNKLGDMICFLVLSHPLQQSLSVWKCLAFGFSTLRAPKMRKESKHFTQMWVYLLTSLLSMQMRTLLQQPLGLIT